MGYATLHTPFFTKGLKMKKLLSICSLIIIICLCFSLIACGSSGNTQKESDKIYESEKESEEISQPESVNKDPLSNISNSLSMGVGFSYNFDLPENIDYSIISTTNEEFMEYVSFNGKTLTLGEEITAEFSFVLFLSNENSQKEITVTVRAEKLNLNKTIDLFLNSQDGDKNIDIIKDLGLFRGVNENTVYSVKFADTLEQIDSYATKTGVTVGVTDDMFGEREIILSINGEEVQFKALIITKAIKTAEELINLKSYGIVTYEGISSRDNDVVYKLDGYFVLANSIDLTGYTVGTPFSYAPWACEMGGTDWGLIGTFNGKNNTLYGGDYINGGIFGCIGDGAVVKNLAVVNVSVLHDRKGVLAKEIRNCRIENVLVDVVSVKYEAHNYYYELSNGGALGSLIYNVNLKDVVVYFPTSSNSSNGALASHVENCYADNVYVISNMSYGGTKSVVDGSCYKFARGTVCDDIDFVGFGSNWVFTSEKAEFISTGNFL